MKCIRFIAGYDRRVVRVSDQVAEDEVQAGRAIYVPKSQWKEAAR